jgi:hypothetical protein
MSRSVNFVNVVGKENPVQRPAHEKIAFAGQVSLTVN